MKKTTVLAAAMLAAAFLGGAFSNWIFNACLTPAVAQQAYGPKPYSNLPIVPGRQMWITPGQQVVKNMPVSSSQGMLAARGFHFLDESGNIRYTLTLANPQGQDRPRLVLLGEDGQVVTVIPAETTIHPVIHPASR